MPAIAASGSHPKQPSRKFIARRPIMFRPLTAALLAAGIVIAIPALSADRLSKAEYNKEKERISAEFKADKARCASLSGNAKDICQEEAKGKEKTAKAEAEASYKGTAAARTDALIARADADYAIAKEKCDDLAGNAKDVCVKEAKAAHTRAKVDAKANRKVSEIRKDAAEDKRDASYEVAKERCETFAGDAKAQCVKEAKARFGKT
jgi:cytoskeletal protein RodZ